MTTSGLFRSIVVAPPASTLGGLRALDTDVRVREGPVIVAIDDTGHRHLLVPVASGTRARPDLGAAVSVRVRPLRDGEDERTFVDVTCTERRLDDLFDTVTGEMLEALHAAPDGPHHRTCLRVLDRWRQLLRRATGPLLGAEQLAGLFGELCWLRRLVAVEPAAALAAWKGPSGGRHDLVGADLAVEVKAVSEGSLIEIHGSGQLEPPSSGPLLLAVVHLEPGGTGGESVPVLVDHISDMGVDTVRLLGLLAAAGYDHADREVYEGVTWRVVDESVRTVTDDFPRVTPSTARHVADPAVGALRYSLRLDLLPPPDRDDLEEIARSLVGAA